MWHPNYPFKRFIKATEPQCATGPSSSTIKKEEEAANSEEEFLRQKGQQLRQFYEELTKEEERTKNEVKKEELKEEIEISDDEEEEEEVVMVVGDSVLEGRFLRAIQAGDLDLVRQLLGGGSTSLLECRDRYGWSPLMVAAAEGRTALVDFLLKRGADLDVRDKSGLTALDIGRQRGHQEVVAELLHVSQEGGRRSGGAGSSGTSDRFEVCDLCGELFAVGQRPQHLASLAHQLGAEERAARPHLAPIRPGFGITEENRGFQLLLKSGWDGCSGLGEAERRGRLFPIKSVLKSDRIGLGGGGEGEKREEGRVTHFGPHDERGVQFRTAKAQGKGYCSVCHKKYEADVCGCKERSIRQDLGDL